MTSRRCSACSYAKAMQRAAKEVLLLAWSSAVALSIAFVAFRLLDSAEAARGIAEFLYRTAPIAFNTSMLIIVFSRVFDVATMQRYMREFNEPCPYVEVNMTEMKRCADCIHLAPWPERVELLSGLPGGLPYHYPTHACMASRTCAMAVHPLDAPACPDFERGKRSDYIKEV